MFYIYIPLHSLFKSQLPRTIVNKTSSVNFVIFRSFTSTMTYVTDDLKYKIEEQIGVHCYFAISKIDKILIFAIFQL